MSALERPDSRLREPQVQAPRPDAARSPAREPARAVPAALVAWAQPLAMAVAALDDEGRLVFANAAFEHLTGIGAGPAGPPPGWPWRSPDEAARSGLQDRRVIEGRDGRRPVCDVSLQEIEPGLRLLTLIDRSAEARLEGELGRLEGLLELIQSQAPIGLWERDLRTGLARWDEHMFAFYGLDPARGAPTMAQASLATLPRDQLLDVLTASLSQPGRYTHRYRLLRTDGSLRRVRAHWEVSAGPDGTPERVAGVLMDDLTGEGEEASRGVGDPRADLELAIELADVGMWRQEVDTGNVYFLNPRARLLLAGEPGEGPIPVEVIRGRIHPDDRAETLACFERALRSTRPEDLQARYPAADGTWRTILTRRITQRNAFGEPIAFNGVALDITEEAERLRRTDDLARQLDDVTAAAGIGVWRVRRADFRAEWNAYMYEICGLPREAPAPLFEEWAQRHVHPDERAAVRSHAHSWFREPGAPTEMSCRILRPDGTLRHVVVRARLEPEPNPYHMSGVLIDVTEVREAAAARQERELVLRESQAKSELLARMSHELRTPMNAVLGFTQLLLADDDDEADSPRRARLQHIRSAGEHLLTLINDVLELSRLDGPEGTVVLRPVRLDTLVIECLPLVERLADQHDVVLRTAVRPLHARADPTRLKQVLVNLLTNGIKYNRPGGFVQVDISEAGSEVVLQVSDSGIGMTGAQQAEAFEPFNRAGAEGAAIEGTGIGLTIVRALVDRMGGRIEVRSIPGQGSRFDVWLEAAATPGAPALPVRRLLYIEDNPVNVLIVSELVRRRGDIEFETAGDGAEGIAQAARTLPGLVLVDMHLPDMGGMEVLRRLRADPATAGLKLIALSANAMPEDIAAALNAGFDDYWTKPLDFGTFLRTLDLVFGKAASASASAGHPT